MNGHSIGITADRAAVEQGRLVRSMGGVPVFGASVAADIRGPLASNGPAVEAAIGRPVDEFIFLTGIGAEVIMATAEEIGAADLLHQRLREARVTVRGPKPRRALRSMGVRIDEIVLPASTLLLRDQLLGRGVEGKRVVIQDFGPPPEVIATPLTDAGADVLTMTPYVTGWPRNPEPARALARAAASGGLDAITFTSARAGQQFLALAESADVSAEDIHAGGTLICSIGPVTTAALRDAGVQVHLESDPPRMGAMYRAVASALDAGATGWEPRIVRAS